MDEKELNEESYICLRNIKNSSYFVWIDDSTTNDTVKLIRPDGSIRTLARDLFAESEHEMLFFSLTKAQQDKLLQMKEEEKLEIEKNISNSNFGVEYKASRLTFIKSVIEKLNPEDYFIINCRDGRFRMSKENFYDVFSNVRESISYRSYGNYNYQTTPQKAYRFLIP